MNKYKDDYRLTAYILGELDGDEKAAFEAEVERDSSLKEELNKLSSTIQKVEGELKDESLPQLANGQREEVEAGRRSTKRSWFKVPTFRIGLSLATAAAMVLMVIIIAPHVTKDADDDNPNIQHVAEEGKEEAEIDSSIAAPEPSKMANIASSERGLIPPSAYRKNGGMAKRRMAGSMTLGFDAAAPAPRHPQGDPSGFGDVKPFNTERYSRIYENEFIMTDTDPRSTFSIDVDTASYANVRRFLNQGTLPPADSVRTEEMINYFKYSYPAPKGDDPFSVSVETVSSPWNDDYKLVRIGIKGKDIDWTKKPKSNLVFLIDVSGSMSAGNKLPLLKRSMMLLTDQLTKGDRVSIVVYAGSSGLVLKPTNSKKKIAEALERLDAGGSTNGGAGIELAYKVASDNFIKGGINRVVLATDGDFNVGSTDEGSLTRLIEKKAKSGVFLSVLGFGMGNYNDSTMEKLADKGNGNYSYVDSFQEAKKVLVEQLAGTMITIAKDVKIQIEFNPAAIKSHRLIGYENRKLQHHEFNDDKKDAGDIGAGHTVTALYEIVPVGAKVDVPDVDPLKYQGNAKISNPVNKELMTVKLRYKKPDGKKSKLITVTVNDSGESFKDAGVDMKFASAVASFGMLLRDSKYKGSLTFEDVVKMGKEGKGQDVRGYRGEFIRLVEIAKSLK